MTRRTFGRCPAEGAYASGRRLRARAGGPDSRDARDLALARDARRAPAEDVRWDEDRPEPQPLAAPRAAE